MELLKFILGWMLIILLMATPILVPLIVIQLFFGGIASFMKGLVSGQIWSVVLAVAMLAVAVGVGVCYMRWTGIGQEVKARSTIGFIEGAITPEMLARPRAWHGRFATGPYAAEVVEHLMLTGKIDTLVGDRRFLPLKRETPAPSPNYWDETYRLKLKNAECFRRLIGTSNAKDQCFEIERIEALPREPHFSFMAGPRASQKSEYLVYRSGAQEVKIATCTVEVDRPLLPSPQQYLDIFRAQDAIRTGKMRVGRLSAHDKKEFEELRECRVELLRQFAAMI